MPKKQNVAADGQGEQAGAHDHDLMQNSNSTYNQGLENEAAQVVRCLAVMDRPWFLPESDVANLNIPDHKTFLRVNNTLRIAVSHLMDKVKTAEEQVKLKTEHMQRLVAKKDFKFEPKKKVPVLLYMPPYFKDKAGMCPSSNSETKKRLEASSFDPIWKEEKRWSAEDTRILSEAVRNALLDLMAEHELLAKIKSSGLETSQKEKKSWQDEVEFLNRKIDHIRSLPNRLVFSKNTNYDRVNWSRIANISFKGTRSAVNLRMKWYSELRPHVNNSKWTEAELQKLKELREHESSVNWLTLARKMPGNRSAWQCFVQYKSQDAAHSREWTPEEDEKLMSLVEKMTVNGKIQWDKVTYYMTGRHRQQVRTRYMRTLDKSVKRSRWTDDEDLLLMCAVDRFGSKDWSKIAKVVGSRTDTQCRERWVTVLDDRIFTKEWSLRDDERLLYAVSVVGIDQWGKCAQLLPERSAAQCKQRFEGWLSAKIRLTRALRANVDSISSSHTTKSNRRGDDYMEEELTELQNSALVNANETNDAEGGLGFLELLNQVPIGYVRNNRLQAQAAEVSGQIKDKDGTVGTKNQKLPKPMDWVMLVGKLGRRVDRCETKKLMNKGISAKLSDSANKRVEKIMEAVINSSIDSVSLTAKDKQRGFGSSSSSLSLPPSMTTCAVFRRCQMHRVKLLKIAALLFRPLDISPSDAKFMEDDEVVATRHYEASDVLNFHLQPTVVKSESFAVLKSVLYSVLAETQKFVSALEGKMDVFAFENIKNNKWLREVEQCKAQSGELDIPVLPFSKGTLCFIDERDIKNESEEPETKQEEEECFTTERLVKEKTLVSSVDVLMKAQESGGGQKVTASYDDNANEGHGFSTSAHKRRGSKSRKDEKRDIPSAKKSRRSDNAVAESNEIFNVQNFSQDQNSGALTEGGSKVPLQKAKRRGRKQDVEQIQSPIPRPSPSPAARQHHGRGKHGQ